MSSKPATPASVILEVIARTCGQPVRGGQTLGSDLLLNDEDLLELRAALELALECELGEIEIDGRITVSDLIDTIIARSKAA